MGHAYFERIKHVVSKESVEVHRFLLLPFVNLSFFSFPLYYNVELLTELVQNTI